jgi:curved DNA-binding protein CbpA
VARTITAPAVARTATTERASTPPAAARDEVIELIRAGADSLDLKADHFVLLGLTRGASAVQVRDAYFDLARKLHPDRLTALDLGDEMKLAHRVFAAINAAFAVLSHPKRRADYEAILDEGGQEMADEKAEAATEQAMKMLEAEAAFQRGEMALRRNNYQGALHEFRTAVELNPDEADHQTMYGWALWVASTDKAAVKKDAMAALSLGSQKAPKSAAPHLYLGRIARQSGNDAEAMREFQEAIKRSPGHSEATSELRVLEARKNEPKPEAPKPKGGLFSKLRGG